MKRIVILGAAESGAGAAVLAKKEGYHAINSNSMTTASHGKKATIPKN